MLLRRNCFLAFLFLVFCFQISFSLAFFSGPALVVQAGFSHERPFHVTLATRCAPSASIIVYCRGSNTYLLGGMHGGASIQPIVLAAVGITNGWSQKVFAMHAPSLECAFREKKAMRMAARDLPHY